MDSAHARASSKGAEGVAIDFGSSILPAKRPRSVTTERDSREDAAAQSPDRRKRLLFDTDNDKDGERQGISSGLMHRDVVGKLMAFSAAQAADKDGHWRLSREHSVGYNEVYLNEQLEHVAVLPATKEDSDREGNGGKSDGQEQVSKLNVGALWQLMCGATSGLTKEQLGVANTHIRDAMDVVSYLLYVRDQEIEHQNYLGEKVRGMQKELERKQHVILSLREDAEGQKQAIAQQQNIFKAKEKALISERKQLQTEKKSLEVQCARLQGVETSFRAQMRRKDAEYERLRKNLQDSIGRMGKEKRGLNISKPLNDSLQRRPHASKSQSNESKLAQQIVANLERKNSELLFENDTLANSYDALQRQLESLTAQYKKTVQLFLAQKNQLGGSAELEQLANCPIDDFTPTPFNMAAKRDISAFITESMYKLNGKLAEFENAIRQPTKRQSSRDMAELVSALQRKLADAHLIIQEQDQLVQASLFGPPSNVFKSARDSSRGSRSRRGSQSTVARSLDAASFDQTLDELEEERRAIAVLRKNLESERQQLHEQSAKLDQDRLAFEISKHDEEFGSSNPISDSPTHTSLSHEELKLCSTPQRASSSSSCAKASTPVADRSEVHMLVPASPATAALLKTIGIVAPTQSTS